MRVYREERIYGLDALRAVMMLLGIVLHAGITYGVGDYAAFWPIKDKGGNILFDVFVAIIHHFRMPVFFVMAGFFGALLFYKKGAKQMLSNRIKRIVLPFFAGVLLVYPLAIFGFSYSNAVFTGVRSPLTAAWGEMTAGKFLPFNVLHLWFLYFLIFYSFAGCLLALAFRKESGITRNAREILTFILRNPLLRLLTLAVLVACCLFWIGAPYLTTNNSWQIDLPIFTTYFVFFETGWIIYRTGTIGTLNNHPFLQIGAATLLFFVLIFVPWPDGLVWMVVKESISALLCSLYIFGFIALFISRFNHYSRWFIYLVDAAYWVYIIHLPLAAFLPGLLYSTGLPVLLRFVLTLTGTFTLSIVSYHFFVRHTVIGKFLNGKISWRRNTFGEEKVTTIEGGK